MDKWLRNTNVVKVVALAIGILLWVVVHLDVETNTDTGKTELRDTKISNVMIQAIYDETQYAIVSIDPGEVTVSLKGDDAKIREINPGNLKIAVDLSKLSAGTYELPVTAASTVPKGVTLDIVPKQVKVVMEEKKMKEIPVQIDVTGKPAEGYKAGQPITNPSRVYISAPASKIDLAATARAEVNIESAKTNVVKKVKLAAYDAAGNEVKGAISPPVLEVEVPITLPYKAMPLQIKWVGQPAKGYAVAGVQKSVEQITVYSTQDVLDKMEFYEGLEIDLSGLKDDKIFSVDIPVKNKNLQVEPAKVDVKVTIVPSVTKVLNNVPIMVNGISDAMAAKVLTPENGALTVTVEGAPSLVDKLRPQDVQASVNASNLPPGTQQIPISIGLPPFVKQLDKTGNATVEITSKVKAEGASAPTASPTPGAQQEPANSPAAASATPEPLPSGSASSTAAGG